MFDDVPIGSVSEHIRVVQTTATAMADAAATGTSVGMDMEASASSEVFHCRYL